LKISIKIFIDFRINEWFFCRLTKLGCMKSFPDWVQNGGKSPVGRTTFIPYWFYAGIESLFEAGLIGPVQLLY